MLNRLDDYPIHQTPEPVAHPATSDRNVYDRYWFNGYTADGRYYFGLGMAVYPHRQVQDAAFSVVTQGGLQHCFYGSRRAPEDRTETEVGPLSIEIETPMLRTRVRLKENDSGISCDLVFSGRSACIQEGRQTFREGHRIMMDATRFDQFGRWSGWLETPEGRIEVKDSECLGTKDRSWGVRPVGERVTDGAPQVPGSFFFLWAPLFWNDHVSHAIFFDDREGRPLFREALTAPLYESEEAVPGVEDGRVHAMAAVTHRVRYHPQSRLAAGATLDFYAPDGSHRTIELEPILRFQFKGLGYGHPEWRQGNWMGELACGHESFDPAELNLLAPENIHVQQVVRARDGTREGVGVLEQLVIGPYAPAGFTSWTDGAER